MQLRNGKTIRMAVHETHINRPTHVYVGAGSDTSPFNAKWVDGSTIHCIDSQPHSEFGVREYYPSGGATEWSHKSSIGTEKYPYGIPDGITLNGFARPNFAQKVVTEYLEKGFECSLEDHRHIEDTGLLGPTYTRFGGGPTRIRFVNLERDIIIWYHFNTSLPDDADETLNFIGTYDGIICRGHWPHRTIIDNAVIPDKTLTFRGYAGTCFGIGDYITDDDVTNSMIVRLSFSHKIRRKFKHFVFYDTYGTEHWFDMWEEFLVFYERNPELIFEEEDSEDDDNYY